MQILRSIVSTCSFIFALSCLLTADAQDGSVSLLYCGSDIRNFSLASSMDSILMSGIERPIVVDYHFEKKVFFWSDKGKTINKAPLWQEGARPSVLKSGVYSKNIAVDWIHNLIYLTDHQNRAIDVASLDGSMVRTIIREYGIRPYSIALNPAEGFMFWSDSGNYDKIERCNMDGTSRKVIIAEDISLVISLTIDLSSQRIFWVDIIKNYLSSATYDGNHRRNLITELKSPTSVDVYGQHVYFVATSINNQAIYKASKVDGSGLTEVLDGDVSSLKVFDRSKQPQGFNVCGGNNGGCSHLCLSTSDRTFSCACPNELIMSSDNFTCLNSDGSAVTAPSLTTNVPSSESPITVPQTNFISNTESSVSLLYCDSEIRNLSLASGMDSILISGIDRPIVVDYHLEKKVFFWSDEEYTINKAPLWQEGARPSVFKKGVYTKSLALDWIHNLIYWTDHQDRAINVARLDGSMEKTIIRENGIRPYFIVLNPAEGFMFWSDSANDNKIERCNMDGKSRKVIVKDDIFIVTSLTIDLSSQRIFWVDYLKNYLSSAAYDGNHRRNLITKLKYPTSIDIYGEHVYFVTTSNRQQVIFKASKVDGSGLTKVLDGDENLSSLKVFDPSKQSQGINVCGDNNGGCSHLCLPIFGLLQRFSCACPNGLFMDSDNFTCLNSDGSAVTAPSLITNVPSSELPFTVPQTNYISNTDLQFNSNRVPITVQYNVRVETDVSLGKSWHIEMPASSTLHDVMMTVQSLDPTHRVKFNMVNDKPFVISVSGLAEDPECDKYWYTYKRNQEAAPDIRLLVESPVDVHVSDGDEYIISYR